MSGTFAVWVLALVPVLAAQTPAANADPPPDPAAQDRLLDLMTRYGEQYVSRLPNFLCVQVTREFEAGLKSNRWHRGDTLTARLSFHDGEEKRTIELVNGKRFDDASGRWHKPPLSTEGEFGTLLSRLVDPASEASFTWNRWDTVRGKRVAVFDYTVDKAHSTLTMRLSDLAEGVLPYHGSVYIDPDNGAVWRVTDSADADIPPALEMKAIGTVIDYAETVIGGRAYLLPASASVLVVTDTGKVRNDLEFRDYRKFETDSTIRFGDTN